MFVENCCFGRSLRTGTIAIGYLYTVLGVFFFILTVILATLVGNGGIEVKDKSVLVQFGTIVLVVLTIIQTVVSVGLIYGVRKEKDAFLKLWLCNANFGLFLCKLYIVYAMVQLYDEGNAMYATIIVSGIQAVMYMYFKAVVKSYMLCLHLQQDRQRLALMDKLTGNIAPLQQ